MKRSLPFCDFHSEAPIRHLLAIAKVNFGRRRSKRKTNLLSMRKS
jgi:hypothetical protein